MLRANRLVAAAAAARVRDVSRFATECGRLSHCDRSLCVIQGPVSRCILGCATSSRRTRFCCLPFRMSSTSPFTKISKLLLVDKENTATEATSMSSWSSKASKCLRRCLLRSQERISDLEVALLCADQVPTKCVPIETGGSLCSPHRQTGSTSHTPAHFIACRLWRWSDLQSYHELRSTKDCKYPYKSWKMKQSCINPYHYQRVVAIDVPSVLTVPPDSIIPLSSFFGRLSLTDRPHFPPTTTVEGGPITGNSTLDAWASLAYFELAKQHGDTFYALLPDVHIDHSIDGANDPSRLALGLIATLASLTTLDRLGYGLHLLYLSGDVYLDNYAHKPIYIQSANLNMSRAYGETSVIQVLPGKTFRVFSRDTFRKALNDAVKGGVGSTLKLLRHQVSFRVSLAGFGAHYRRKVIRESPAWLKIQVDWAARQVEEQLKKMDGPSSERNKQMTGACIGYVPAKFIYPKLGPD